MRAETSFSFIATILLSDVIELHYYIHANTLLSPQTQELSHISHDYLLETLLSAKRVINAGPAPGLLTLLGHSSYTLPALLDRAIEGGAHTPPRARSNNILVHLAARGYGGGSNIKRITAEKAARSPVLVSLRAFNTVFAVAIT